jgi:hypothetical protein
MTGIVAGAGHYLFSGARFTLLLLVACLLSFLWETRDRKEKVQDLAGGGLTLLGGYILTAAPVLLNEVRIVRAGRLLAFDTAPVLPVDLTTIFAQTGTLWLVLITMSALYATWRLVQPHKGRHLFPLVAWWWLALLLRLSHTGSVTTGLAIVAPVACFLVAFLLYRIVVRLQDEFEWSARQVALIVTLLVVALTTASLGYYL